MNSRTRPVGALLAAAQQGLKQAVQPELQSDHGRAQLAAVLDILSKLERMVDWSGAMLHEEEAALAHGIVAFEQRARLAGMRLPAAPQEADPLEAARARSRQLADWLFGTVPAGATLDALDGLLRGALRQAVAAERRHVPRTDFSAMTESKET
ncbi:MAG: hypothetical protein JSS14_01610 [Proteobacteria bacterium]|nr:hypothetical protein [Pseudomonadota bacterium]